MLYRLRAVTAATLTAALLVSMPALAQENDNPDAAAAQLEVHISQLEEQIRQLQGTIEQVSYENKQLKAQLDRSASDTNFRLTAIEKAQAQQATAAAAAPANAAAAAAKDSPTDIPAPAEATKDETATLKPTSATAAAASPTFTSSRDHYNYAFKILQQARYEEAGASFVAFVQHYPKDPLVGNAYYWLGETFYVRRDYLQAADSFRQGYEAMPTGPKAPDNLLKLAMSLDALGKDKDACVVLKQVEKKFGSSTSSITPRAEREMNRIGCN